MSCCVTITDLGCSRSCSTIDTGEVATIAGNYIIDLSPGGGYIILTLEVDEPIAFENVFNEDSITIFQIRNPNGDLLNDGECWQVKTQTNLVLT